MPSEQMPDAPKTELTNPARQLGGPIQPTAVVLHRTIGHWPGDLSVGTHGGQPGYVSFHFLVGEEPGQWTQFVGPNGEGAGHLMNHAAGANDWAFGIEISGMQEDALTPWQVDRVAAILRWADSEWGIAPRKYDGSRGRITHYEGVLDHRHVAAPANLAHYDGVDDADWAAICEALGNPAPAPAPGPTPDPAPAGDRMLRRGDTGSDVADLQRKLGIADDGIFGPQTDAAVRAFQQAHGCQVDGIVGPQTRAALNAAPAGGNDPQIQQGSQGPAVSQAQQLLNQHGANIAVDGIFGPQTDAAVRSFQQDHGCQVDGIVGPQTWAALRA